MHVINWLDIHARKTPERPAIIDAVAGETVSYGALQQRVEAQTARLVGLGIGRGDRVAVLSANRVEILELLFACARLGAVLAPLNTRLATPELSRILDDCRPALLIVEPSLEVPPGSSVPLLPIGPADPVETGNFPTLALADDPLLILYTGGTTGVPKGAVLTQSSIACNAANTVAGWGLTADDRAPVFTPMFHTGGLNVLATPLFSIGGSIVLPGPFSGDAALASIHETACTVVFMVPTMFTMLREARTYDPALLSGVRKLISGGAPAPQALMEAYWRDGLPLCQGYGLTEAGPNTFGVTLEEAKRNPGTVGRPLPGVEIRLDAFGELLIRGGHVMAGYWEQVEATAEALQDGWLHTGDLARMDAEGLTYICGRRKEMYISGGENVFPAEVEDVLLTHPDVMEAAVVGIPDGRWGEVGKAWLVLRPEARVTPPEVVAYCRERMAAYKAPKQVALVEALPKSPAGKVLKRLLCTN